MQARWNGKIIAESDVTIIIEGNHYFPPTAIHKEFYKENTHTSECPWKGTASYYDLVVDGETNKNAAWYYRLPFAKASQIKDYVAFWHGVEVLD